MADAAYQRYANALKRASELAQRELEELVSKMDETKPAECRDLLLAAVPAISDKYGAIAATAAAEYYESERAKSVPGRYRATIAPPIDHEAVKASVRYACRLLFDEGAGDEGAPDGDE